MSRQSPVSEVMTTEVLTFTPDDNVGDAMRTLVDRGIDGAPVVTADGEVVGMLSTGDLIVQESRLHFPTVISLLGATLELPSSKRQFDEDATAFSNAQSSLRTNYFDQLFELSGIPTAEADLVSQYGNLATSEYRSRFLP